MFEPVTRREYLTAAVALGTGVLVGLAAAPVPLTINLKLDEAGVDPPKPGDAKPTGGTYWLKFRGRQTKPLRFDHSPEEVRDEMQRAFGVPFRLVETDRGGMVIEYADEPPAGDDAITKEQP